MVFQAPITHQEQQGALETNSIHSPIIVLDNGACSIKAGFAGLQAPTLTLPNCTVQPFGRRHASAASGGGNASSQASAVSGGASQATTTSNYITGDDIYLVPEYFCMRPFDHGLLADAGMESLIWERLFSKSYLNVPDTASSSLLVTENYNTPTNARYALTQMVFEEFNFERLVISPAQQLVPFAFTVGHSPIVLPMIPDPRCAFNGSQQKIKARRGRPPASEAKNVLASDPWCNVRTGVVGDCCAEVSSKINCSESFTTLLQKNSPDRSYCQLVVDVGHHAMWVLPMYGELPIESAVMRSDIGGAHCSALLKNLLSYRQLNLERNEMLVHHIKSEYCFISLNYEVDLKLARSKLTNPAALGPRQQTHLTRRCGLPDLNAKETNKAALKQYFKTLNPLPVPRYKLKDAAALEFIPAPDDTLAPDFRNLMQSETNGIIDTWTEEQQSTSAEIYLGVERIRPGEVVFRPGDYDFFGSRSHCEISGGRIDAISRKRPPNSSSLKTPDPAQQCGIAELIERSIYACPAVLQPLMASRILLCGGASTMANFSRRLYVELRRRLPQVEAFGRAYLQAATMIHSVSQGNSILRRADRHKQHEIVVEQKRTSSINARFL